MSYLKLHFKSFIIGSIWAILFIANANSILASATEKKDEKLFGDWKVVCSKSKDGKKNKCVAEQGLTTKKDDKDVLVASYRLEMNDKREMKLIEILPLGAYLESGTAIVADGRMVSPGKFISCLGDGCIALAEMTEGDLEILLSSKNTAIGVLSSEGAQNNLPFSTNGLRLAIAELRSSIQE
ncbi:MAG: invasion associated locus B family protein [Rickettsiaceae bacterium]|nr:invasion associated locus B family protein [Rickettsiaceae bacterium]